MSIVFSLLALAFVLTPRDEVQLKETNALRFEGDLSRGPVSVFFGHTKFGELACVETLTDPTVVFSSDVRSPGRDFSMNAEFLRDIVEIADVEYAKAKIKRPSLCAPFGSK